jgi:6-pyruvoyltetrahydropterin/6-carboxytetrahydropterin synthase
MESKMSMSNKVSIFRKEYFNAAHRLFVPAWSNEENERVFGLCNNPNFHGHNYELIVKITGVPDAATGFVIDLNILSHIIKKEILDRFDHKNLNMDIEYFKEKNPTTENIAVVIYKILREKIDKDLDVQVRLYETERNFAEYPV